MRIFTFDFDETSGSSIRHFFGPICAKPVLERDAESRSASPEKIYKYKRSIKGKDFGPGTDKSIADIGTELTNADNFHFL